MAIMENKIKDYTELLRLVQNNIDTWLERGEKVFIQTAGDYRFMPFEAQTLYKLSRRVLDNIIRPRDFAEFVCVLLLANPEKPENGGRSLRPRILINQHEKPEALFGQDEFYIKFEPFIITDTILLKSEHIELMKHTVMGGQKKKPQNYKTPDDFYRNRFVTDYNGRDGRLMEDLVSTGYATVRRHVEDFGGSNIYYLSEKGLSYAHENF